MPNFLGKISLIFCLGLSCTALHASSTDSDSESLSINSTAENNNSFENLIGSSSDADHAFSPQSIESAPKKVPKFDFSLTGIVLFEGADPVSAVIKSVTHSPISHVGALLTDNQDQRWCFEATGSASEVIHFKGPKVRLIEFDKVVKEYQGGILIRYLELDAGIEQDKPALNKFIEEFNDRKYERNIKELLRVIKRKNKAEKLDSIFCSELVAALLERMNLVNAEKYSNNYQPADFAQAANLILIGAKFGEEERTKLYTKGCCVLM